MMYRLFFVVIALTLGSGCIYAQDNPESHFDSVLWAKANPKDRALHQAINRHDLSAVRQLLSEGANPNAQDRDGKTLLMTASRDDANATIIQLLIDSGADVNAVHGRVLLYAINENDNPKNVTILIKAGANVNARWGDGSTALMDAASNNHADIIRLLHDAGADVNAKTSDGRMAIDYADSSAVRDLLIKAGANPNGHLAPVVDRLDQETTPRDIKMFERDVCNAMNDINKYQRGNDDSLEFANAYLEKYLEKYLARIPQTLTAEIPKSIGISVVTSPDHRLRFWSWNTYMGGSMPQIQEFAEYKSQNRIEVVDPSVRNDGNQDSWIEKISAIQTKSGQTVYLAISGWQGDGMHVGEQINAYAIKGLKLTDIPFFKTKHGMLNSISYYSHNGVKNRFKFRNEDKTFLVPLALDIKGNDDVTMTSRSLRYAFNGNCYVYRGVSN